MWAKGKWLSEEDGQLKVLVQQTKCLFSACCVDQSVTAESVEYTTRCCTNLRGMDLSLNIEGLLVSAFPGGVVEKKLLLIEGMI